MKISRTAQRKLSDLAHDLTSPDSGDEAFAFSGPFRGGRQADDPEHWFYINSSTLDLYEVALEGLVAEPLLAHRSKREIDAELWALTTTLYASAVSEVPLALPQVLSEFEEKLREPSALWDVLLQVDGLGIPEGRIQVSETSFQTLTSEVLSPWLGRAASFAYADEVAALQGSTVALTQVSAGDSTRAIEIARATIKDALDRIRFAIISTQPLNLPDNQLLFSLGRRAWAARADDPDVWGSSYELGFRPVTLTLNSRLQSDVQTAIDLRVSDQSLDAGIRRRIELAGHWIAASAMHESADIKLIALCTAAEALLATKADGRKGEAIVLRAMVLSRLANSPLPNPSLLFSIYQKRSSVVHGSQLGIAAYEEYKWLRAVMSILVEMARELVRARAIASVGQFIAAIGDSSLADVEIEALKMRGDQASIRLAKALVARQPDPESESAHEAGSGLGPSSPP